MTANPANNHDASPLDVFNNVLTAAAGVIGLLYVVGVVVITVRLWQNGLPGESVLSQLPQQYLLAVGLSEVVLPTLAFLLVYILLALFQYDGKLLSASETARKASEARIKWISWIGLPGFVALGILIAAYALSVMFKIAKPIGFGMGDLARLSATILVILLLAVVIIWALGRAFDSDLFPALPKEKRKGATLATSMVVTLVAFIVWGFNAVATPLDYVKVCAKTTTARGVLVASTSDTIYMGEYPGTSSNQGDLDTFSKSDVMATVDGHDMDAVYNKFVCPKASSSSSSS
jgi:hypothetical protein